MNITPSQSTLQAFGNSLSSSPPAAQARQAVSTNQVEKPAPNVTQRVDAAPRTEAPARPDADARPAAQASAQPDRPGARVDIVV
jgi:hypothetical protein